MFSSNCTSSSGSSPSSPLHKSCGASTPPPPPIPCSLMMTDDDNDAMSDECPEIDASGDHTDSLMQRSTTNCKTIMQSTEQNLTTVDPTANNLLLDSSDGSASESHSFANKDHELPNAGTSSTLRGKGLQRIDPKSKKILKSKLVSVRKSQLTPRMALYIPPHLQKQTQHVPPANKAAVSCPLVALTPQQKEREKEIYEKFKLAARANQLKQYDIFSTISSRTVQQNVLPKCKRKRNCRKPLSAKHWTTEMEALLLARNTNHEKFVELGEEDKLKKSKLAKIKLRKMLRKARSKPSTSKNMYIMLEKKHEDYVKSEAYKKFKGSNAYKERKSGPSNDSSSGTSFEMSHDIGDLLEPEYDSSFFLSLSQRHEARMEWSEAILEFNSSPANRLRSPPEIVKVEVIDSDEDDSVQHESPIREKSSSLTEKNPKRYGKFDAVGRSQNASTPRSSKQSTTSGTSQGSLDVSNNEYLNQQFLRRQHDYEREQKYQQIELASESNEFLRGSSDNLFRGRDTMDDPLRLHSPLNPFPPMFGASGHSNSLQYPPICPIPNVFSSGRPFPEREPEEPFVGERRRRRPHPALVAPMLLGSGEPPIVKDLLEEVHGRNHSKVRRPRSFSPGSGHPIREINGSRRTETDRNPTLFRSSRENSPVVRNYSNERVTNREYPSSRPLSPFSERIRRATEKNLQRTSLDRRVRGLEDSRQLSPFSERMQNRESSARRLSPFSERMRSRDNIDRHYSPCREDNFRTDVGEFSLHKSTPHPGGHKMYSGHPGDERAKLGLRRVRSSDDHMLPADGTLGKRDGIHLRGSATDRHGPQRNNHRRDREIASHVLSCPRFALQTNHADTRRVSSSRRRDTDKALHSTSNSRIIREKLPKRNHEASKIIDSRKTLGMRKRARDGSSSGAYQSSGKRPRH